MVINELEEHKKRADPYQYSLSVKKDPETLIKEARLNKKQGQNDIIYDGFNQKKTFKFEQYNRLIKLQNKGKKYYDPLEIMHGDQYKQSKKLRNPDPLTSLEDLNVDH